MAKTHGMSRTKEYLVWQAMRQRCNNPNDRSYHDYGGRGIGVCERWKNSFENFMEDMGERPEGYTLERIDNNKGYEPSNCRWDSRYNQILNRRLQHRNQSGVEGVWFHRTKNRWQARLNIKLPSGRKFYSKLCDSFDEAVEIRKELERKYR